MVFPKFTDDIFANRSKCCLNIMKSHDVMNDIRRKIGELLLTVGVLIANTKEDGKHVKTSFKEWSIHSSSLAHVQ